MVGMFRKDVGILVSTSFISLTHTFLPFLFCFFLKSSLSKKQSDSVKNKLRPFEFLRINPASMISSTKSPPFSFTLKSLSKLQNSFRIETCEGFLFESPVLPPSLFHFHSHLLPPFIYFSCFHCSTLVSLVFFLVHVFLFHIPFFLVCCFTF